ncbi:MAG: glycosyl hydrolase [Bacteroidales bacterium]|nr:glycosyl hydrolase [Bacteroidales bacterium]
MKIEISKESLLNRTALFCLLFLFLQSSLSAADWSVTQEQFVMVPLSHRPNPLWFWNNARVEKTELESQMTAFRDQCGYGGLSILPFGENFRPEYLSEEYFTLYRAALEKAKELGMTLWLYDEYGFPSGGAGLINGDGKGRFMEKYPYETIKRLDKEEYTVKPGSKFQCTVPDGLLMAAVAMDTLTFERIDLEKNISGKELSWNVPEGKWKVMFFLCREDEGIVDYLDPEAAKHFINLTHDQYYKRFAPYFGNTLVGTFFDEPTLYRAAGRCWTPKFNEKFRRKYGFSPALYYPALWYNIGEATEEARNYLYGFRAELYAAGFTKEVNDWSARHNLKATGHQDNEEIINAVGTSADLMKCFKYLEIPGIDKIGGDRPAELFYKVVSGSAYNWDHSLVMSETYGAMGDIDWNEIFSIAMDQYAKGINLLIPHAVWYDTVQVTFRPELSHRHRQYADSLKAFTDYLTRLNILMQNDGRFVADVAMLYPVNTMQSGHYFDGPYSPYEGSVKIPELDYVEVSRLMFDEMGVDFLFLHPEVMEERCKVEKDKIKLQNKTQYGDYSVLILPACRTISLDNLKKAYKFYQQGGKLIFTTKLPEKATKEKDNKQVKEIIAGLFPEGATQHFRFGVQAGNKKGGKVLFIEKPTEENLQLAFSVIGYDGGVLFESPQKLRNIHKIVNGKNVWFFANPTPESVNAAVTLKESVKVGKWNPHNGEVTHGYPVQNKNGRTALDVTLAPYQSVFFVEE